MQLSLPGSERKAPAGVLVTRFFFPPKQVEMLMPPRDPDLPEGTDKIITGSSAENDRGSSSGDAGTTSGSGGTGSAGSGSGGGFVATRNGGGDDGRSTTDKLVTQVREQVVGLRGQATDKLRGFADDGKGRATNLLDDFAGVIDDAARSIDSKLGSEYGDYAHRASSAVSSFADQVRDKSVDDLIGDTREIVRKSPGIALAAAAVVGFALMRVIRTGLDNGGSGGSGTGGSGNKSGTRAKADTANASA